MLTKILDFLRHHVVLSLLGAVGVGATTMFSIYEARVNRVEEMKIEALQSIADESAKFHVLLEQFTFELAKNNVADPKIKSEISTALVVLYSKYGSYRSNLPEGDSSKVARLQSSINQVKKNIQTASEKSDLERIGTSLLEMFRAQKIVDAALRESVGRDGAAS